MTLYRAVGWIAVCLPFAVFFGNWIIFSHHRFACLLPTSNKLPYSLSGYYYSHMRNVFIGAMSAAGVFLLFYRGHDWWDRWITNFAGAFALGIALFPTKPPDKSLQTNSCGPVTPVMQQPTPHATAVGYVHVACLFGLMIMIGIMALRFARKYSDDQIAAMTEDDRAVERDTRLKNRNRVIYRWCCGAIVAAGLFAVIQIFFSDTVKREAPWLLYAETIAFLGFGIAWFVKGRAALGFGRMASAARKRLTDKIGRRRTGAYSDV